MQANQDSMQRKPTTPKPALATAVLVGLLILHILAVVILRGAETEGGAQAKQASTSQSTD